MSNIAQDSASHKRFEIWLKDLNTPWREVRHLGVRHLFPKHHMEPGDNLRGFYFLTKGTVKLSSMGTTGQERSSLYIGPNSLFNEVPALLGQIGATAAFFCLEEVEAWRFAPSLLSDPAFVAKHPHLFTNMLISMAKKSSTFFVCLSERTFSSSISQFCAILLQMTTAKQRLSQSEVATMLGLHPTTVARFVRTLRDEGVLGKFTKTELEILDIAQLKKLAESPRTKLLNDTDTDF